MAVSPLPVFQYSDKLDGYAITFENISFCYAAAARDIR